MQEVTKLSFEEALGELETLARRLEEGKCPLDEAVKTFERGIALKTHCDQMLKSAKLKVDQILVNTDGNSSMQPFAVEDSANTLAIKNVA
jgi:exodeoxyribonuclease VII small subunit